MTKYHNRPLRVDGLRFDSRAEARRYQLLRLLERAGAISDLRVHPRYTLLGPSDVDWWQGPPWCYVGDFAYVEAGRHVVEDVKGAETAMFRLKARVFRARYHQVELRIVRAEEV